MEAKYYFDLDGTLSSLNSTFDFIRDYLEFKRMYFKLFFARVVGRLLRPVNFISYEKRRRWMIMAFFKGLDRTDLSDYARDHYLKRLLTELTPLGKDVIKKKLRPDVLLTGCTEIPAKIIGRYFGFKEVIATEFVFSNNKIAGISRDTFGNLKIKYVEQNSYNNKVYYTDDVTTENELYGVMDKIIHVRWP